jgi:nucleotide-binding universal stress UspA family protein
MIAKILFLKLIIPPGLEKTTQRKEEYTVRSLLEPEITITGPLGDKLKSSKQGIHPNTSFDEGASGFNTPVDSDAEADLTDIKRAQKLSVNMTSVVSTPATNRCVRTIYRGDFAQMQREAHDHQRRVRKYLVATDLSDEAAHALEWTIGTVLRDGDTLLAIYCVDEELGIATNEPVGDDPQLQAQAAAIAASTKPTIPIALPAVLTSPLSSAFKLESSSAPVSPMGRGKGKAEQERFRAVQDITDRVSKLLRKTKLQVKVVIEVIHCKSPKHLITEVIDYISPTLVILGSRGRSALKGFVPTSSPSPPLPANPWANPPRRSQRHSRLLLQLPRHQILRPRHGRPQAPPQAHQVQAARHPPGQQPRREPGPQEPGNGQDRLMCWFYGAGC